MFAGQLAVFLSMINCFVGYLTTLRKSVIRPLLMPDKSIKQSMNPIRAETIIFFNKRVGFQKKNQPDFGDRIPDLVIYHSICDGYSRYVMAGFC